MLPSSGPTGSLMLVLHSHLPYVLCHGRTPHGADWLSEAAAECYVPLLDALNDLLEEGISPRITVGVTPVLAEMLADPIFIYEFTSYLQDKMLAAERDEKAFRADGLGHLAYLASMWRERFERTLRSFRVRYRKSILGAFRQLQDAGHIEIITSAATHGYLPLISQDVSVQAQIKQGVQTYRHHFGRDPRGFWLPECAYRPRYSWAYPLAPDGVSPAPYLRKGVEEFLGENGLRYFVVEAHLLKGMSASADGSGAGGDAFGPGVYTERFPALKKLWSQFTREATPAYHDVSLYQAHYLAGKGEAAEQVAVFARDPKTGHQVWSAASGYPGDEWYLEFHKKHAPGGHRYHRVTGAQVDLGNKREYEPHRAQEMVESHAHHFVQMVKSMLREERDKLGAAPVICAPYDTELFGHWWFEGVDWLKGVIRRAASDPEISLATGCEALERHASGFSVTMPEGSWGEGGFHWVWLNQDTQWAWKLIYEAEERMRSLAAIVGDDDLAGRLVRQTARELLLLQSSDWPFNITTSTSADYAELRLNWHYRSFCRLADLTEKASRGEPLTPDEQDALAYCEERDSIFPDVDPVWFAELEHPPLPTSAIDTSAPKLVK